MGSQRPTTGRQRVPRQTGLGAVRIWLLEGFRVSVGPSRSIGEDEWRLKKSASLVKLLALAPAHRLHREQAMELLWPELDSKAALNNLHHALHIARRTLQPSAGSASGYLRLRGENLALCPEGVVWVDVEAFEQAASTARHALEPQAYRAAIDLYSGELLPQDRYEGWAEERRAQLRGLYLSLLLEVSALYEERKEFGEAIEALGRLVGEDPTREEAHVGLMRLYALLGRRREALSQYERLRDTLIREFGVEPEEATVRLHEEIWAGTFPPAHSPLPVGFAPGEPPSPAETAKHNLSLARTSFIGRERETLEVKRLLSMTRLLTLTGAGGCGKTRLALKVASELAGAYPDGAWLVELGMLSEGELVPQAVSSALGVREEPGRPLTETLKDTLRARQMLLVLDNCEHLIEGVVHLVDALLGTCPRLRVLATSRETLNVADEVNWVVPSLTVPDSRQKASTAEQLEGYESVRLFIERARQRDPAFVVTPRNGQAVVEVCRRLDGIPLAVELAAARVGVLSAEQISSRLDHPLKLLTAGGRSASPRHRTLRATLDWSHELLDEPERELFGQLSVFAGGLTLEAAEAVGAGSGIGEDDVLDLLSRLVDKSLVVAEAGAQGASRYRMLDPVRLYARERLEESGKAEEVRRRHASFFLALAEEAEPELRGPWQAAWVKKLEREQDNLRAAMAWLLGPSGELEEAARLGWALWLFWWVRGRFTEGRSWMEEALAKGSAMPAMARARALFVAGMMADGQADLRSAQPLIEEGLGLFRELGDKLGHACALGSAGLVEFGRGRNERGITLFEEAVDLFFEAGETFAAAFMLNFSAAVRLKEGSNARAKRLAEQALRVFREIGGKQGISVALYILAMVAQAEGDYERARRLLQEGIKPAAEVGDESNVAYCLQGLAALAASEGGVARAARLWGAAEALLESIEATAYAHAPDHSLYQGQVSAARAELDEAAWQAAWAEGQAMTPEQAMEYALSKGEKPPTLVPEQQPPADESTERLTTREREVALLVARGLTNRQIAQELSVSRSTANNHVARILRKLGLRSRAQIAAWVTERRSPSS
jgi:predicted ATPase/DNA-binding SARP family transcriptional activator/DNA-binding CsgD family transcriptional regulator